MIITLLLLIGMSILGPAATGGFTALLPWEEMTTLNADLPKQEKGDEDLLAEDNETAYEDPLIIDYTSVGLLDSEAAAYQNSFEIVYESEVPDSIKETVEEYTSMIPAVILENVADNGFVYKVDPSGNTTKKHAGMTMFPDCIVDGTYLHTRDNLTPPSGTIGIMGDSVSRAKMAAIHEVGHAVDFIIGAAYGYSTTFENETYMSLEGDPVWQKIFAEENEIADFPDYNRTCPLEYFAEVFRYVFEDPSKLDNIPKSRQYVIDTLESFYGITIDY